MCFPVSYAGFFAKSQIMFFLLSSFRFCPPLKNDGRGELHFARSIEWKLTQKKSTGNVSCPRLSGKVSTDRLTKGASVSRNEKSGFYRAVLHSCLSFLNGRKKRSGIAL